MKVSPVKCVPSNGERETDREDRERETDRETERKIDRATKRKRHREGSNRDIDGETGRHSKKKKMSEINKTIK